MLSLRILPNSYGVSPFLAFFGRNPNVHTDALSPLPLQKISKSTEEFLQELMPKIKKIRDVSHSNHFDAFLRIKKKYDSKTRQHDFVVGQKCYLSSPPTVKKFSAKLQHRFPRLYEIISQENLTNFKVRDVISQKILKFPLHVSRMKHVQGSRAPLEKYGPFSNPDLPTIPEEAPQNDPPYNADDFNDNWDDIYEEHSL